MIDVNVNLSRWPFRRLAGDETPELIRRFGAHGVTQAWAGSFDALLHNDIGGVNIRVAAACKQAGGFLLPVGAVNPMLPDWREDLRRCHEDFGMRVIRLHPNYHGYTLDSPECDELFGLAGERGLILQLAMRMVDYRISHRLVQVPITMPSALRGKPLEALIRKHPELRVIVMNNYGEVRNDVAARLAKLGQVYFEISHAEQVGTLEKLAAEIPVERLLLGSHFPLFSLESTMFKFRESRLPKATVEAIQQGNARRLLAG